MDLAAVPAGAARLARAYCCQNGAAGCWDRSNPAPSGLEDYATFLERADTSVRCTGLGIADEAMVGDLLSEVTATLLVGDLLSDVTATLFMCHQSFTDLGQSITNEKLTIL